MKMDGQEDPDIAGLLSRIMHMGLLVSLSLIFIGVCITTFSEHVRMPYGHDLMLIGLYILYSIPILMLAILSITYIKRRDILAIPTVLSLLLLIIPILVVNLGA